MTAKSEHGEPRQPIDKSTWPDGPWLHEPDRVDFVRAGYACMIQRNNRFGFLCGYVGVDESHPYFGRPYQELPDDAERGAHGGCTYANFCCGEICHVPAPGMPARVWWFGFDCGHAHDLAPGLEASLGLKSPHWPQEVYRDLPYVRRCVERLAHSLRNAAASAAVVNKP